MKACLQAVPRTKLAKAKPGRAARKKLGNRIRLPCWRSSRRAVRTTRSIDVPVWRRFSRTESPASSGGREVWSPFANAETGRPVLEFAKFFWSNHGSSAKQEVAVEARHA